MNMALFDNDFLESLNEQRNHTIYVRIISLNFKEQPMEKIEGRITGGSINIDGTSAIRRNCSLTFTAKDMELHDYYWSLNTKIKIEIGLQNDINSSYDDIIWFPQGVYLITSFNISQATNNYTVNVTAKDKMCLLNGELGGAIGLETNFGVEDIQEVDLTTGEILSVDTKEIPIKQIISDLVHSYGHEPFSNIIINNLDTQALAQLVFKDWSDTTEIIDRDSDGNPYCYLVFNENTEVYEQVVSSLVLLTDLAFKNSFTENSATYVYDSRATSSISFKYILPIDTNTNCSKFYKIYMEDGKYFRQNEYEYSIIRISVDDFCGYRVKELVYDGELIGAATDTVTSILDKIVKKLGEFEYFYNTEGQFVFQAKQTYTQGAWNNIITTDQINYVDPDKALDYLKYSFEGSNLITSFQNNPNINNIKNDYIIWGERNSSDGVKISIHAHYAIDIKPVYYKNYEGIEYVATDHRDLSTILLSLDKYQKIIPPWAEYYNPENTKNIDKSDEEKAALLERYKYVCENWWDILDWAEYYSLITGDYPSEEMFNYQTAYDQINLNEIFNIDANYTSYTWSNWQIHPCAIFDTYPYYTTATRPYGTLGFTGHNPSAKSAYKDIPVDEWTVGNMGYNCVHKYSYFLKLYNNTIDSQCGKAYFFKPKIPSDILNQYVQEVDWREIIYQMALDYRDHGHEDDFAYQVAMNNPDYYPTGITGYEQYYKDLESYWRYIYDPTSAEDKNSSFYKYEGWHEDIYDNPSNLTFWFDFFSADNNNLEKFSTQAIGTRSKVVKDTDVKVITYEQVPKIIYLSLDEYLIAKEQNNLQSGYNYVTDKDVDSSLIFVQSSQWKTAQEMAETLLYNYGQFNETITIQALPIYYLNPNTLVYVHDEASNINHIYIVNKITLPLAYNGTMTINATKLPDALT